MPKQVLSIKYSEAKKLMISSIASAKEHGVPGAIAIVDQGGHLVLLERLPNTMYAASDIAIGKAATAVAFQRSTKDIEDVISKGRSSMLMLNSVTPQPYVPLLGGHPIIYKKQIIGGIAVAGTMDAKMDDVVALEALSNWKKLLNQEI